MKRSEVDWSAAGKEAWKTRRANGALVPTGPTTKKDLRGVRKIGLHLVRKKDCGNSFYFDVFELSRVLRPSDSKIHLLSALVVGERVYERMDRAASWLLPPEPTQEEFDLYEDGKKLQLKLKRLLILRAYPEAAKGIERDGGIWLFKDGVCRMDASQLDDLLDCKIDMTPFAGWTITHDCWGRGKLALLPIKQQQVPLVEVDMPCNGPYSKGTKCKNKVKVYLGSGCHHGAFCYVIHPKTGKFLADLRNQVVLCDQCS